jgi:Fe-S-cluster containining protein
MSACDTCPNPGHCCHNLKLFAGGRAPRFTPDAWKEEAEQFAKGRALPFYPVSTFPFKTSTGSVDPDVSTVGVMWDCYNLTAEGRCGDYENRPQLCRDYAPKEDELCILHEQPITIHPHGLAA